MNKLMGLGELKEQLKQTNKKIALCVRCFDAPVHPGHVNYLKEAKNIEKDLILVVSVTGNNFVNKGPSRPMFDEKLRAEVIGSLEMVDYVFINQAKTVRQAILDLGINYLVKGSEFKDKKTPELEEELSALQEINGSIVYTSDAVVFSSSELINRNYNSFPAETRNFIEQFKNKYKTDDLLGYLDQLKDTNVLLIGEAILDEYVFGETIGKSSKDPTLVMEFERSEVYGGGVLAIANHISSFVKHVNILTYIGDQEDDKDIILNSLNKNVSIEFVNKKDSKTIKKSRFIDRYYKNKLFEVYKINQSPLNMDQENNLIDMFNENLKKSDLIMVADFGHGLIGKKMVRAICATSKFTSLNIQANAGNFGFNFLSKYPSANLYCVDEREVRLETRNREDDISRLIVEAYHKVDCEIMVVTQGTRGSSLYSSSDGIVKTPSFASLILDRVGSGDCYFSLASLMTYIKAPKDVIAFFGNVAGAMGVAILGNKKYIDKNDLSRTVISLLK